MKHSVRSLCAAVLCVAAPAQLTVPSATYPTIQSAIDAAAATNVISVLPGVYLENLNLKGKAITLTSVLGPATTILDGGGTSAVIRANTGETRATVVSGFTIRNGNFVGNGGGLSLANSSPTVKSCVFLNNNCSAYGGGIGASATGTSGSCSPLIEDCKFIGNTAKDLPTAGLASGGGIGFAGNTSGAISAPEIRRCEFRGNSCNVRGGGYYCSYYTNAVIEDCVFIGNFTINTGAVTSLAGGAAVFASLVSNTILRNCVMTGNFTNATGGAIKIFNAPLTTIVNCTIVGNTKGSLSGITTTGTGGTNNTLDVVNSILWSNGSPEFQFGTTAPLPVVNVNYSDVSGGYAGTGNLNTDPMVANPASGNVRLLPGSPCLDAGNSAHAQLPLKDFEGDPRILGPAVDIGADESIPGSVLLYADRGAITVSSPGTTTITIEGRASRAGQIYAVLASLSGTKPGLDLFGMHLPLNFDALTNVCFTAFPSFSGFLDAAGHAAALMPLGSAPLTPALVGLEVSFAAATMTPTAITAFSNADVVQLVP